MDFSLTLSQAKIIRQERRYQRIKSVKKLKESIELMLYDGLLKSFASITYFNGKPNSKLRNVGTDEPQKTPDGQLRSSKTILNVKSAETIRKNTVIKIFLQSGFKNCLSDSLVSIKL